MMFAAGLMGLSVVVMLITYICYAIGGYRVFTKFGEAGWKAFVPFYNTYIQYSKVWNANYGIASILLTIVTAIGNNYVEGSGVMSFIMTIVGVAGFVLNLLCNIKLSKSFGHDVPFGIGLTLLQPIFIIILGFGSDEYIGNTSEN